MTVNTIRRNQRDRKRVRASRTFLHKAPISHRAHVRPKQSVYYWWYEYLKRNEQYRRCCHSGGKGRLAGLYRDFGDIFTGRFKDWWEADNRGERLFAEPLAPVRLEELRTADDWDAEWTRNAVLVVVVPLGEPKRRIERWFDRLLKRRHTGRPGHPTKQESGANYKVHSNFSVLALEQMLMVYDFRRKEPDLTLAEIGKQLKLVPTAMPKTGDSIVLLAKKRNTMAATVSRYLKKAKAIIRNATDRRKEFPCAD
jgi:hypothetical protein